MHIPSKEIYHNYQRISAKKTWDQSMKIKFLSTKIRVYQFCRLLCGKKIVRTRCQCCRPNLPELVELRQICFLLPSLGFATPNLSFSCVWVQRRAFFNSCPSVWQPPLPPVPPHPAHHPVVTCSQLARAQCLCWGVWTSYPSLPKICLSSRDRRLRWSSDSVSMRKCKVSKWEDLR